MNQKQHISNTENDFTGKFITPKLLTIVRRVGRLALEVQRKGLHAVVKSTKEELITEGDTLVTQVLKADISKLFPGCVYLDEETQETHNIDVANEELVVVIDPVDGTTNYYEASLEEDKEKRNEHWGISIGFVKNGELVAGIIEQPQAGNTYYAEKGKGAYKNGKKILVSSTVSAKGAKLVSSPPYPKDKDAFAASQAALARMEQKIPVQVTRLNSQVIETMQVAEGKQDVFVHFKTKPWDIAAAGIIVLEAGGRIMNVEGNKYKLFEETILLTNALLDVIPLITIASEELHTKQDYT